MLLLMLFMAVTSAGSAELIAVSSLITYDIYRTYINPEATGEQLLRVSRFSVVGFGLFMGCLGVFLHLTGLNLNYGKAGARSYCLTEMTDLSISWSLHGDGRYYRSSCGPYRNVDYVEWVHM